MVNRPRMDRAERAKQFMPFAALKGYEEALREREKRLYDSPNRNNIKMITTPKDKK